MPRPRPLFPLKRLYKCKKPGPHQCIATDGGGGPGAIMPITLSDGDFGYLNTKDTTINKWLLGKPS